MKKLLYSAMILSLVFATSCNKDNKKPILGKASFATDQTWTISNDTIFQIWSDAVQTDYCSGKADFMGIDTAWNFLIDCRSNPECKGDLFSLLAVMELKNELCPYPWRVPTREDFINLDIAMGGTGKSRREWLGYDSIVISEFINENYLEHWGGAYGGNSGGYLFGQGIEANYWSLDGSLQNPGIFIFGKSINSINIKCCYWQISLPEHGHFSQSFLYGAGRSLRCIRDN